MLYRSLRDKLDLDYIKSRAKIEGVEDLLKELEKIE